jgi:hypothetical protein
LKLLIDLDRLHKFIFEGRFSSYPSCEVISAGDLLAAKFGASPSKVMAAYSGWGAVHGNGASYTRMALTLVDKVLSGTFKKPQTTTPASVGGSKRKRAESGSSGDYQYQHRHSGPSRRHSSADRLPLFTHGGSRGGGRGGNPIHFGKRGSGYSGDKRGSGYSGDKRFNYYGDHSSGGPSGGRSSGGGGYKSRY